MRHVVDAVDYQLRPGNALDLLLTIHVPRLASIKAEVNGQSNLGLYRAPIIIHPGFETPPIWRDPNDPCALRDLVSAWEEPFITLPGTLTEEMGVPPPCQDVLLTVPLDLGDYLLRLTNTGDAPANSRITVEFTWLSVP